MVEITVYKNAKDQITGFSTFGHAGYDEEGQDIVCAAISVLVINTINAIDQFTDERTSLVSDEISGKIDFHLEGNPGKEAMLLLDAMLLGLENMAEDETYRNYMDLIYEEV